jgi:hypothetical protein
VQTIAVQHSAAMETKVMGYWVEWSVVWKMGVR